MHEPGTVGIVTAPFGAKIVVKAEAAPDVTALTLTSRIILGAVGDTVFEKKG